MRIGSTIVVHPFLASLLKDSLDASTNHLHDPFCVYLLSLAPIFVWYVLMRDPRYI